MDYSAPIVRHPRSVTDARVIFVRHGSVHNPRNVIYGRLPRMRLASRGQEEVERTALQLASAPVAAIYSSPLLRARQTAWAIARHHPGLRVRQCADLMEVHTSWQGESNKAVREIEGFSYYDPLRGEGDETILDVFRRMNRALEMVLRRHPGETTVCVSHGDPIKILRTGYSGRPLVPDTVRAPDPGQGALVTFHFWHHDTLPIIWAVDPTRMERIIQGIGYGEPPAVSNQRSAKGDRRPLTADR